MILIINFIHLTALHLAVENEDVEIVKLLLSYPNINVNSKTISLML